jgi:hypothetical protein
MFAQKFDKMEVITVVSDGMIGRPDIQSGRLIPVLVIDCARHPALEALIHAHKDTPPGDVVCSWGWNRFSKKNVYLRLRFKQPIETSATIPFQVLKQGVVVESILNARAVYLQPLTSGNRVSEGIEKPKIIVEIPASASFPIWQDVYRRELEGQYRSKGLSRTQAKSAVKEHLGFLRDIQFRRRSPPAQSGEA